MPLIPVHPISFLVRLLSPLAVVAVLLAVWLPAGVRGRTVWGETETVSVDLHAAANNRAFGSRPGVANFDGTYGAYPRNVVPASGALTLGGIEYDLLRTAPDNVVALGQTIALPPGQYSRAHLLVAASYGKTAGTVIVHYADGGTSTATLAAPDWNRGPEQPALASDVRFGARREERRVAALYAEEVGFDLGRQVVALTLPHSSLPQRRVSSIHIFAISLQPVLPGSAVRLTDVRASSNRLPDGSQVVEGTLENVGSTWIESGDPAAITVAGADIRTTHPAVVAPLAPGEEAPFEIGVQADGAQGTQVTGQVTVSLQGAAAGSQAVTLVAGNARYTPSVASLETHEAPQWYDGAKFGIFIHYGVYSIPAWAPVGGVYAEWYWHSMNEKGSPTYLHQLQTYGPGSTYDDFIPRFTAAHFNPRAWVELFKDAGARYFVFVSKHHDGFALFRTAVSRRNSVAMGPHRDLVAELFAAARRYAPEIHPGLYYSLPEWYNPAYAGTRKHHDHFPGGPPHQFVSGKAIPYTGYMPVRDYVRDVQVPQMRELIDRYHPDVLWCDIGGPNDSLSVLAQYYNDAAARHAQVAVNNRCGVGPHDFTTPEYRTFPVTVRAKWEASRGIDPHSYGYNANTPPSAYATSGALIGELVDIVSKGGNFLLDIGPRADGTIPDIMQDRLRAIGGWLRVNGEGIYDTVPWWRTPEDGKLRFTVSPGHAFYVTSLARPGPQVVVHEPVPIHAGNSITLLGWNGGPLHWTQSNGALSIDVPAEAVNNGRYAWVFKIS